MRFFINTVCVIITIIVVLLFIRYMEWKNLYAPYRKIEQTPKSCNLAFEDVFITTKDNLRIHGWLIPSAKKNMPVILFFHGNAGNICHRLPKIQAFNELGYNVFIIDYRGYGKSQGIPGEEGLYNDAQAALDYVLKRKEFKDKKIIVFGESLGGAVAVDLVFKRQQDVDALITEGLFASIQEMAARYYPFLPGALLMSKYDSLRKISNIRIPKLIIHSRQDTISPFFMGKKLFKSAIEPKEFLILQGDHNEAFFLSHDRFKKGIQEFLRKNDIIAEESEKKEQ